VKAKGEIGLNKYTVAESTLTKAMQIGGNSTPIKQVKER
jgi:hypothetical protein